MTNTFYYDGKDNFFDEQGKRVYDPMEDDLTKITNPNIVLEIVTDRQGCLVNEPAEKNVVGKKILMNQKLQSLNLKVQAFTFIQTTKERNVSTKRWKILRRKKILQSLPKSF
jgi:histidinol phosphatase-like enzyme